MIDAPAKITRYAFTFLWQYHPQIMLHAAMPIISIAIRVGFQNRKGIMLNQASAM